MTIRSMLFLVTLIASASGSTRELRGAEPSNEATVGKADFKITSMYLELTPGQPDVRSVYWSLFSGRFGAIAAPYRDLKSDTTVMSAQLFDLESGAWYDSDKKRWVNLDEFKQWEVNAMKRAEARLQENLPADKKAYIESFIHPNLTVEKDAKGVLTVVSGVFRFWITPKMGTPPEQVRRFAALDRLAKLREAMTAIDLPPRLNLKVNELYTEYQILPRHESSTVKTSNGNILTTTSFEIRPLSPQDEDFVKQLAEAAGSPAK